MEIVSVIIPIYNVKEHLKKMCRFGCQSDRLR